MNATQPLHYLGEDLKVLKSGYNEIGLLSDYFIL
jgi:hypothetical protein